MAEVIDPFPMDFVPEDGAEGGAVLEAVETVNPLDRLLRLANKEGDFSDAIDIADLTRIGADAVADYERDLTDRHDWAETAKEALLLAAQEFKGETKSYPWPGCSNVRFPLLTTAALQFNARSYPAIVKGDEAVSVKVVGQDRGRPMIGPDGQPVMGMPGPDGQPVPVPPQMMAMMPPEMQQQLQPVFAVPPGGKAARAQRVAEYMNTVLFYRMTDWESDTDTLLIQLPVVGCGFRKVWFDPASQEQKAAFVSAMRIVVPEGARSCDTTPRLTEEIENVYPHQIAEKQRAGMYRDILLTDDEDEDGARLLLEQHRMMDLDEDGLDEPYIVTVDHKSQRVLRIEANFGPEDVKMTADDRVLSIKRNKFYVKYDFFPHPAGKFYGIGLGHLLKMLGHVIDTSINQIVDAGTAQTAGGGFIASGVRLQARGGGSTVRFAPGEYKTVDAPAGVLRDAIVERTLPNVSPVTFQVLDLILGAARDISGVKDVITGDASNNGQVGTTLALIEQGLQVFNAVYKRIYRALKEEFGLIYKNLSRFGGEEAARDYAEIMDDPAANFEADFSAKDFDVRPISDPSSVTRMQKMARAQFLMGTVQMPGANPLAILKRVYEAADVENPEELIMMPEPPAPDPAMMAKLQADTATAEAKVVDLNAGAAKKMADASKTNFETEERAMTLGMNLAALSG